MNLKKMLYFCVPLFCLSLLTSCVKKENKNLHIETDHRDPRVDNFFNAVGLPILNTDSNNLEELTADLSRVSPLFTNASSTPEPFFTLAENIGAYYTSHIWKTQITSPEEVRFFDLGTNVNDTISGLKYNTENFNLPFVFVNPYGNKTDPSNYLGSVMGGFYGKLNFATQKFTPLSHFYIMEYKLRDENGARNSANVRTYYALVSVPFNPTNPTEQYRLAMYSHGGDFGTSTSELITVFGEKLKNLIVVAPLFPGEPLCTQISAQNRGCLRLDKDNNVIEDNIGPYNNPEVSVKFHSITPINYSRSPLIEDVNSFLGAHNAVARTMSLSLQGTNPFYSENLPNHSKLLALENTAELNSIQPPSDVAGDSAGLIPTGLSPQTLAVGASRGGSVLIAAIGRIGFLLNGMGDIVKSPFPHTVQDNETEVFHFQYPLINSAALFFAPASFLTGKLRLLAMMVMQNELSSISVLPMAADLAKNPFFTNYRNDSNYSSKIQLPVLNEENNIKKPSSDSLTQLITFIAANDITFLAPFVSSGLQNWNSFHYEKNVRAPGSLILLHGSQDIIVPMSESTIGAQAMNTVWAGLYNTPIDPYGNYLTPNKFDAVHPALLASFPGVGVAQYSFQPTDHFFNIACDKNLLPSLVHPDVIYNTNVGRCFGGGYSPNADGTNAKGTFHGHMDASFFTGELLNILPEENLSLAVLSSNITTNSSTSNYTMAYDGLRHMRYGFPRFEGDKTCVKGQDNCTAPYNIATNSPTFMRYMAIEGALGENVVAAKKQIFEGVFKPKDPFRVSSAQNSVTPYKVFFTWIDSVACDFCDVKNSAGESTFTPHYGVFHDYASDE